MFALFTYTGILIVFANIATNDFKKSSLKTSETLTLLQHLVQKRPWLNTNFKKLYKNIWNKQGFCPVLHSVENF